MNYLKNIVLLLLICCMSYSAEAQRQMSLEECHSLALENNKQLKIAQEEVNKAEYEKQAAFTNYLPKFSATGTYMHNSKGLALINDKYTTALNGVGTMVDNFISTAQADPLMLILMETSPVVQQLIADMNEYQMQNALDELSDEVYDILHPDTRNIYAGMVSVQQPIYVGGKIVAYNKITADAKELAESKLEMQRQEIIVGVDKVYWQIVSLANKLKLTQQYVDLLQSMSEDVSKVVAEGLATASDEMAVRVKLNEAQTTMIKVQNGLALSKMLLCEQCGLSLDTEFTLADENLEDVLVVSESLSYQSESIEKNRPELKCLSLANDMLAKKVNITRSDFLPTVAAFGNYLISNPSCYNGFQKEFHGMWNFGVVANIPLFHWGEGYHKVRVSKEEAKIAQLNYEEAKEKIMLQVRQCEKQISEADSRLTLTQDKMSDAEENLRMATIGFREGVVTSIVLNEAQTGWMKAHSEFIDAKIDRIMAGVNLRKAVGQLEY
ncbi:MAG: TolC family protein [bacterium]|nr:TolC family protein [Candidatus Limimorpha equi]